MRVNIPMLLPPQLLACSRSSGSFPGSSYCGGPHGAALGILKILFLALNFDCVVIFHYHFFSVEKES